MPLSVFSQSVWERPDSNISGKDTNVKEEKPNPDAKYLVGAVPEVNGKVEWTLDVDVPGKSASQIYDIMLKCFVDLTKTENQLEGSSVPLVNKGEHKIVATIREWLVFSDRLLSLDRAQFYYTLIAECKDNHLTVTMGRISYKYETANSKRPTTYKAEDWITDENALNKKRTRLYPGSAKFRRKTVDRKDYLFDVIRKAVLAGEKL